MYSPSPTLLFSSAEKNNKINTASTTLFSKMESAEILCLLQIVLAMHRAVNY